MTPSERRGRARWVHPDTHEISKFFPHNPPEKGDVVMVGDERCRVLACPVTWEGREWTMKRGVKVRPEPLPAGPTDKEKQDDR